MFLLNKFFLIGVGEVAVAGTGAGLGVYYGTQGSGQPKSHGKPEAAKPSGPASSGNQSDQQPESPAGK